MVSLGRRDDGDSPAAVDSAPERDDYDLPADYKPYVPVAKRRAALLGHLTKRHQAKRIRTAEEVEEEEKAIERNAEEELELAREKARRERTLLQAAQEVKEQRAREGESARFFLAVG